MHVQAFITPTSAGKFSQLFRSATFISCSSLCESSRILLLSLFGVTVGQRTFVTAWRSYQRLSDCYKWSLGLLKTTFCSRYADVTHEVQPIKSGYRIALVYNLINDTNTDGTSAGMVIEQMQELSKVLRHWNKSREKAQRYPTDEPEALVYKLDHKYTDANLKFRALKGLDKVKAEYLRETCADAGICFYLASMELRKEGSTEEDRFARRGYYNDTDDSDTDDYKSGGHHALEDLLEERLALKRIIDLDGNVLAQDLLLDEDIIVQDDVFERDPDDEDYEGWTGNAGATATHWFRDTVSRSRC